MRAGALPQPQLSTVVQDTHEPLNKYLNISSRTWHKRYFPRETLLDSLVSVTPILFSQNTLYFSSGPQKDPEQSSKMAPRDSTKAETPASFRVHKAFLNQNLLPSSPLP